MAAVVGSATLARWFGDYLVIVGACCSLKQLIQHADGAERGDAAQELSFQDAHPLKFLSFGLLMSVALLHACWSMQCARLIHPDIHPAQLLITADGRPSLDDLGQCSVRIEEPDHILASHAACFLSWHLDGFFLSLSLRGILIALPLVR
jgi:serine/threonine protein kinase